MEQCFCLDFLKLGTPNRPRLVMFISFGATPTLRYTQIQKKQSQRFWCSVCSCFPLNCGGGCMIVFQLQYIYELIYIYTHVFTYVYYICIHAVIYIYIVLVCVYICIHNIYTHIYACFRVYVYTYIYIYVYTCWI